jgi:disulfide bond formation protein DsbB
MYPLVVILGIAAIRRDRDIWHYVVPLAGLGAIISTYHYVVEWYPEADSGVCSSSIPCSTVWFRQFGFVTLPLMALCGFALIVSLVTLPPQEDE